MKEKIRNTQKGITLVALAITIIVMLLLSVVSINIMKNAGIIEKVKLAKEEHRASTIQEQKELFEKEIEISKYEGNTPKTINDLLNKLEEEKLITEEEKNTIMQTGRVTIGSKKIIFDTIILPEGYTRCEYLESTGTTKIQTNNSFDMVYDKFEIKIENKNHFTPAFNIGDWVSKKGFGTFYINGVANYKEALGIICSAFSNTNQFKEIRREYDTNQVFVIEYSKYGIYNRGNLISEFTEKPNKTLNYTLTHLNETKTYYFKHYRGNKLINYLIPCLDTNNTPCMYDTVTGQTFYNQGTGEFIAGPIVE